MDIDEGKEWEIWGKQYGDEHISEWRIIDLDVATDSEIWEYTNA